MRINTLALSYFRQCGECRKWYFLGCDGKGMMRVVYIQDQEWYLKESRTCHNFTFEN